MKMQLEIMKKKQKKPPTLMKEKNLGRDNELIKTRETRKHFLI